MQEKVQYRFEPTQLIDIIMINSTNIVVAVQAVGALKITVSVVASDRFFSISTVMKCCGSCTIRDGREGLLLL